MIDIPELGIFGEADGKEVVLGRHDAMETILQLSKHVDEVLLMRVTRQILLFKIADESVEGLHLLGSQSETWPVSPWRVALSDARCLPSSVRGPVDFWRSGGWREAGLLTAGGG